MNKTEESDKRWEGGGKICLKAYQKSGVICKANCLRTSEPRLYRQNNIIINALPPEKL